MMPDDPLWISEADVVSLIDLTDAIDAVEAGLRLQASGAGHTMDKTHATWGDGHTLHAIGGALEARQLVGTKTWAHTAGGATPLLVLWDATSGRLLAIIEAFALGQLRTGSMSGVATRWLARDDAATLALIGSGKQAQAQAAAVSAVCSLARIVVFSPNPTHREAFADRLRAARPDVEIVGAGSVGEAVAGADIVTTVTRARQPFLDAAMLEPGVHVNAIGAITPERQELAADVAGHADLVVVDHEPSARRLASEVEHVERLVELSAIVAAGEPRAGPADLTVFKSMGIGLADVAVGAEILDRARRSGRGRPLPHPERADPRLWRSP